MSVGAIVELVVAIFGWWFCTAMLIAAFLAGVWVAPYFGMTEHKDAMGLLAAIALIWLYEHQRQHKRDS